MPPVRSPRVCRRRSRGAIVLYATVRLQCWRLSRRWIAVKFGPPSCSCSTRCGRVRLIVVSAGRCRDRRRSVCLTDACCCCCRRSVVRRKCHPDTVVTSSSRRIVDLTEGQSSNVGCWCCWRFCVTRPVRRLRCVVRGRAATIPTLSQFRFPACVLPVNVCKYGKGLAVNVSLNVYYCIVTFISCGQFDPHFLLLFINSHLYHTGTLYCK